MQFFKQAERLLWVFPVIIFGLGLGQETIAKEEIVWPYICYKPVYICDDNQLVGGSGYHILNLLWEKMPVYEHVLVKMPLKRVLESAKQGKHQIFYGLYKTPDREKFLEFSIPCRISTPTYLITRKTDLQHLAYLERKYGSLE
jgi:uncharacterized protein (TIGR02285 family)